MGSRLRTCHRRRRDFEKSKATGMYGIGYKDELHQNTDAEGNPVTPIILLDLEYLRRVQ